MQTIIDNLMKFTRRGNNGLRNHQHQSGRGRYDCDRGSPVCYKQSQVEKELGPGNLRIKGSGNQLQQVLINLMINAQQAMEQGGTVKVVTRRLNEQTVEIRVSDTGPGIPPEIQSKIFEPFFTTKPVGKGTGLGLSVSYGIIIDHHGQIHVESKVGKGSTFVIAFTSGEFRREGRSRSTAPVQAAAAVRSV
jgi:signal transduction histidine kinase